MSFVIKSHASSQTKKVEGRESWCPSRDDVHKSLGGTVEILKEGNSDPMKKGEKGQSGNEGVRGWPE